MNKLLLATACVVTLATASYANDFENAELELVATSEAFTFGIVADESNGIGSVSVEYDTFAHSIGVGESELTFGIEYFVDSEQTALSVAHVTTVNVTEAMALTVAPELEYLTTVDDLATGEVYFAPTVGAAYSLNDTTALFADVQYSWNVSDDWSEQGGEARVGADFVVAANVTLTPYISRTFDVPAMEDASDVGVVVGFTF